MPSNSAYSYPSPRTIASNEKIAGSQCPQCGTAVNRRAHHCAKCGAVLTVCAICKSINVSFARFCHICGQPMMVFSPKREVKKVITWETRDLEVLDQAVLAIIKLRGGLISLSETGAALSVTPEEINESIQRLEVTHQIEPA